MFPKFLSNILQYVDYRYLYFLEKVNNIGKEVELLIIPCSPFFLVGAFIGVEAGWSGAVMC